jgi:2-amino-4-hydroxy-6-hydroxymethyldihydropteridine diphosphokinase
MGRATHLYAIGIGSNRPHGRHGRPAQVVEAAIARLDGDFALFDASPIVLNPAHGPAGRDFANAVALIETSLLPKDLLKALKAVEQDFGRRSGMRWGPRVLDLDILAWSGGSYGARSVTIPHPALPDRPFAIGPLATIAPGWRIAGALTARHLAHRLARRAPRR